MEFIERLELSELQVCLKLIDDRIKEETEAIEAFAPTYKSLFPDKNPDNPFDSIPGWADYLRAQAILVAEIGKRMQRFAPERKERGRGLSIRTYAFFHFYTSDQHGKSDVRKAAPEYGQKPGSFYNSFREVSNRESRQDPANVTDLQEAIKLMNEKQVGEGIIKKAISDLNIAEYRPPKK